ncbi:hypothetical protein PVAP13_3NG258279 [Panicum virgatum]|uniref:Uncharacterized protein n=1 Tax=Panicum virgatum TaxID=38727 RepID=A0A8T0U7M0_PANVG|nr:hypothetical protein PVAP13_3NG258279 [Panicum virgatum]
MCPHPRALADAAAGHRIIPWEIYIPISLRRCWWRHTLRTRPPSRPAANARGRRWRRGGEREVSDATLPDSSARSLLVVVRSSPRFLSPTPTRTRMAKKKKRAHH